MVSEKSIHKQLKRLGFKRHGWGKGEIDELPHVILPDEEIYEMVNGLYEGGFALLVATDVRVLLIDKKPLNFLTVEDLRFEMINELDYSHRLFGAEISITSGSKNLRFRSYNQQRLRKLISHVQHCMAESKKQQSSHQVDQKNHLEQINQQLQVYLLAQHQYQQQLTEMHKAQQSGQAAASVPEPEPVQPPKELADFLFAQSLLNQHNQDQDGQAETGDAPQQSQLAFDAAEPVHQPAHQPAPAAQQEAQAHARVAPNRSLEDEMYADGVKEVFGKAASSAEPTARNANELPLAAESITTQVDNRTQRLPTIANPLEISALKVASSKLPMALRNRKFGGGIAGDSNQAPPANSTTAALQAARLA